MKKFSIWIDNYHGARDWGEYWDAHQLGVEEAESFDKAVQKFISKDKQPEYYRKDEETGSWYCWGVKLFEGELQPEEEDIEEVQQPTDIKEHNYLMHCNPLGINKENAIFQVFLTSKESMSNEELVKFFTEYVHMQNFNK